MVVAVVVRNRGTGDLIQTQCFGPLGADHEVQMRATTSVVVLRRGFVGPVLELDPRHEGDAPWPGRFVTPSREQLPHPCAICRISILARDEPSGNLSQYVSQMQRLTNCHSASESLRLVQGCL